MNLKEGKFITLRVAPGLYFPKEMGDAVSAYQLVNNKTGVVEFEEVQLGAAWEAYQHFEQVVGEIYDEMEGRTTPALEIVGSIPNEPTTH
jgi:hypothetical protein